MDNIRHLKVAEVPYKEQVIALAESLLKGARDGRIIAIGVVALETGDEYNEAAVTPPGTRLTMVGALELLKTRIATNVIDEHDQVDAIISP